MPKTLVYDINFKHIGAVPALFGRVTYRLPYFEKRAKALGITLEHYLESVPKSQQQSQNEDKDFDFEIPF